MQTDFDLLSPKSLIIFGCGGHARSVADVYLRRFPRGALLFVDENAAPGETLFGFPIALAAPLEIADAFLAAGDNKKRQALWEQFHSLKILYTIIAPSALISPYAAIESNVFVGHLASIGPEARIGHNTIVNTGAIIEHEVFIGCHSHVGPNAVISGRCRIGERVFIGVGAVVKDSVRIGSHIVVGAGAVVVKDLSEPGIYVGCPAKLSRNS